MVKIVIPPVAMKTRNSRLIPKVTVALFLSLFFNDQDPNLTPAMKTRKSSMVRYMFDPDWGIL